MFKKCCKWFRSREELGRAGRLINPLPDTPVLGSSNSAANKDIMSLILHLNWTRDNIRKETTANAIKRDRHDMLVTL